MDSFFFDQKTESDNQDNIFLEMVRQHITNGLNLPLTNNYIDGSISTITDQENLFKTEQDLDENESLPAPVVYKKRARIKFSQQQLDVLESTFEQHRYPTIDMIDDLVEQLNLPTQKITVWFQNRRARLKKSQNKPDEIQYSNEREDHQCHYDSGINLDEDFSRSSSTSPPSYNSVSTHYIPPGTGYPSGATAPSQNHFYDSFWNNFRYPMSNCQYPSNLSMTSGVNPYNFINYSNCSYPFQETNPYSFGRTTQFYG